MRIFASALSPVFLALVIFPAGVSAQDRSIPYEIHSGLAGAAVGKRQTGVGGPTKANPMERISNRIQNRVQNRMRNRIDRNYDPQANAASPFEAAVEQAGKASRRAHRR